jgi:hypothetical protein
MSTKFHEIREILGRQERCYRELLELLLKQRDHLAKLAVEELDATNNRKETLALQIRSLEDGRVRLCEAIAAEYGVDPAEVTLTFLCERAIPADRPDFERFTRDFRSLASELETVTAFNRRLIQSSMTTARNLERLLRKMISDQPTYTPRGEMGSATQCNRLVAQTL